jgi:hypothetical protein
VATIIPLPVILLDPDLSATAKIAAFAGPSAVHFVVGNFLEPIAFGSSMDLHPVTVLLALALWYSLWGVPGAILAVPITAVVRIVMAQVDHAYAAVVISVLEGRLGAAMEDVSLALEKSQAVLDGAGAGEGERRGALDVEMGMRAASHSGGSNILDDVLSPVLGSGGEGQGGEGKAGGAVGAGAGAGAGIGISIPPRKMASARGLLGADRDGERDSLLDDNGGSETRRSRSDER